MSASASESSASPRSPGLTAIIGPSAPYLAVFTICLLLLLYGYEIFNFSLSTDEELFFHEVNPWASIEQGRWAIGVLARVLPPLGDIPVLSTVIFCCGLGVSAVVLARVLFRGHTAQWAFAGIFVSSPFWPHIAEFNPISWGVGIGCVLLTLALVLILAKRRFGDIWAAGLVAVATGIYQNLFAWFLVLLCIRYLSVFLGTAPVGASQEHQRFPWVRGGLIALGGLLGYLAVEFLLLATFSLRLGYIQQFIRLTDFSTAPQRALTNTLHRCWDLLGGADVMYLGYGRILTFLPLLGLLILVGRLLWPGLLTTSQRLRAGAVLAASFVFAMSPLLVAAGAIPTRALISLIPVNAFLAGVTLSSKGRFKKLLYVTLAAALFVSIWVSVSLFYSDHLARQRDQILAARIMARLDRILPDPPPSRIPFVVIGVPPARVDIESFHKVQTFGVSFFEWGPDSSSRGPAYLRTLGIDTLEPRPAADVAPDRAVIEAMPAWPADSSVAFVNGILVIKFGPMPPP